LLNFFPFFSFFSLFLFTSKCISNSIEFNTSVNTLLNEMIETGEPFVYLRVAGRIIVELPEEEMELYRTTEIISHCVPRCDGVRTLEQYYSSAQNTVKRPNSIQAQLSMLM